MNVKDLFTRCLVLLLLGLWLPAQAADQDLPLIVGVAPYLSTRTLLAVYRPLQTHLQGHLGSPVEVFTAVDFRAFYGNAINGDYDLAIMPAHFARLAQRERRFVPLARYTLGGRGLLVAKGASSIAKTDDLRGKVVAAPDRPALGAIVVFEWMRAQGLRPDQDFTVFQTPSFNSAIHALDNGDAVGAPAALAQMAPVLRGDIRVIADADEFQNRVFLGHPRLTPGDAGASQGGAARFRATPMPASGSSPKPVSAISWRWRRMTCARSTPIWPRPSVCPRFPSRHVEATMVGAAVDRTRMRVVDFSWACYDSGHNNRLAGASKRYVAHPRLGSGVSW